MGCNQSSQNISDSTATESEAVITHFIDRFVLTNALAPESLDFLRFLEGKHPKAYSELLRELNYLCIPISDSDRSQSPENLGPQLYIQAHHFDVVIDNFLRQIKLKVNIEHIILSYFDTYPQDLSSNLSKLREVHLLEISAEASDKNQAHHSEKHAVEMATRAQLIYKHSLGIHSGTGIVDTFLRSIHEFAIECHDYIQGSPQKYPTVEQDSAALVIKWLTTGPYCLTNLSPDVLDLVIHQIQSTISIATTKVFGKEATYDLTSLRFIFEKVFIDNNIPIHDISNTRLCDKTRTISDSVNLCDTVPYAVRAVVQHQADDERINSYQHLLRYSSLKSNTEEVPSSPIMKEFFDNPKYKFRKYFSGLDSKYDKQAFLMGLIPKLGMRLEFARKNDLLEGSASIVGDFIRKCQSYYGSDHNYNDFAGYFDREFDINSVDQAIEEILLAPDDDGSLYPKKIRDEHDFSISQYEGAKKAAKGIEDYKRKYCLSTASSGDNDSVDAPIVEPDAILADADNILAFYDFYKELSPSDKNGLLKEISLNMVLQAGTIYLEQLDFSSLSSNAQSKSGGVAASIRNPGYSVVTRAQDNNHPFWVKGHRSAMDSFLVVGSVAENELSQLKNEEHENLVL
ncbi:MAG: hypothetical protein P1U74_04080 [Legionellaceae bacterium]|nr:hypothetical protein [Legionellaceae bacterium]